MSAALEVAHGDGDRPGIHHVGIEADAPAELDALRERLRASEAPLLDVGETTCCFARSDKAWTMDPNGVRWEAFRSFGEAKHYGARTSDEVARLR